VLEVGGHRAVRGRDRPLVVVEVHVGATAVIIGSIASVIPGWSRGPRPGSPKFGICGSSWIGAADAVAPRGNATTEKPAPSTTSWTACEMSPTRLPARACAMPASSACLPTSSSRADSVVDLADGVGVGAVGDEAVERDPDVDRDQVALLDAVPRRDAVDDHRVRGDAGRGGKPR
jgi:hypothetical protein